MTAEKETGSKGKRTGSKGDRDRRGQGQKGTGKKRIGEKRTGKKLEYFAEQKREKKHLVYPPGLCGEGSLGEKSGE